MRFLFVGDTHSAADLEKLRQILPGLGLTRRDAIIHCGDFGAPWVSDNDETLTWWRALPLKKIICRGNHENYGWILKQPLVHRYNCSGRDLGGNLFVPLSGETAHMVGRSFWFYPGGYSIDYPFRTPGRTLFVEELLLNDQAEAIMAKRLKGPRVDYVISHDGPRAFILRNLGFPISPPRESYWAKLNIPSGSRAHPALLLDQLYDRQDLFGQWYFGHHHHDIAEGPLRCLWEQMVLENTLTGQIRLFP